MKKISTLIILLSVSIFSFAQQGESARWNSRYMGRLSVSTLGYGQYLVMIDGKQMNSFSNDRDMQFRDIRPGYHNIRIYRQGWGRFHEGKRHDRTRQLLYESNLNVKPNYHVDVIISRFGRVFIDERLMDNMYNPGQYDDGDDWGYFDNEQQAMNSTSFSQFLQVLKNERFDNTRLVLAKQTISGNRFTTAQVKDIVQLFGFDNSKLDIAKYSYANTVDRNNYFLLNDAFAFSSSREELARYIQEQK